MLSWGIASNGYIFQSIRKETHLPQLPLDMLVPKQKIQERGLYQGNPEACFRKCLESSDFFLRKKKHGHQRIESFTGNKDKETTWGNRPIFGGSFFFSSSCFAAVVSWSKWNPVTGSRRQQKHIGSSFHPKWIRCNKVNFSFLDIQENYNTPVEHTPGNPPAWLWKESLYGLLVKV